MKDSLSAPGLRWEQFNSLRTEEDEPIYIYIDEYMRRFVLKSVRGGRVCTFNLFLCLNVVMIFKIFIGRFKKLKEMCMILLNLK